MSYSKTELKVRDFIFIPKHFLVPDIIEKRKPLSQDAKRRGWVGCNILIDKIPEQGKIHIVQNEKIIDKNDVIDRVQKSKQLEVKNIQNRGWLFDVLRYVNCIKDPLFTLDDIYRFEHDLKIMHPQNNNIKPKIRQQLQFLRDKGFIEFLGKGHYKKLG